MSPTAGGWDKSRRSPNKLWRSNSIFTRVSQCLSSRSNWHPPPSLLQASMPPPPPPGTTAEDTGSPAGERVGGGPNTNDWRKSLALFLLCKHKYREDYEFRLRMMLELREVSEKHIHIGFYDLFSLGSAGYPWT
jgi:hypothetical protein